MSRRCWSSAVSCPCRIIFIGTDVEALEDSMPRRRARAGTAGTPEPVAPRPVRGNSSGGEGTTIAAGGSPLSLGADLAGRASGQPQGRRGRDRRGGRARRGGNDGPAARGAAPDEDALRERRPLAPLLAAEPPSRLGGDRSVLRVDCPPQEAQRRRAGAARRAWRPSPTSPPTVRSCARSASGVRDESTRCATGSSTPRGTARCSSRRCARRSRAATGSPGGSATWDSR